MCSQFAFRNRTAVSEEGAKTSRRILLVDPDSPHRRVLKALLEMEGHRVVSCAEETVALSYFARDPFEFVIADHSDRGVNGLDLLTKVKEMKRNTPVLLISALADWGRYLQAMNQGALDYLHKPLDYEEIQRLLRLTA